MTHDLHPVMDTRGDMAPRERFLAAVQGRHVDRPPLWFMRQAGRYLPEYRELRRRYSFRERLNDPALAARITLQPIARFPLDAAVLFSDILVPLEAMGVTVSYTDGPVVKPPVRQAADIDRLQAIRPQDLDHVLQALKIVRDALPGHAVLGFAGAPFTLACYLVQGGGGKGFPELMRFLHADDEQRERLMGLLVEAASTHLIRQARCGADAVQVFDTWAELLAPQDYEKHALPYAARVIERVHEETSVPVIYFARGTAHLLPLLPRTGADVWSVDWRVPLRTVREVAPRRVVLQGNLDPAALFALPDTVRRYTKSVLEQLQGDRHVFNLGHGILPGTPLEGVQAMVDTVTRWRP